MQDSLTSRLMSAAQGISSSVARILRSFETINQHMPEHSAGLEADVATELRRLLEEHCPTEWNLAVERLDSIAEQANATQDPSGQQADARTERVLRLCWEAWSQANARRQDARRPDVLALTRDILTNPDFPEAKPLASAVITTALRIAYGVEFHAAVLRELREVHNMLRLRFDRQIRRRTRKEAPRIEQLAVDVLILQGYLTRSITQENRRAYYEGFVSAPFGVDQEAIQRKFGATQRWPELRGRVPEFSELTRMLFAQPLGVPGFDDILGGLLPVLNAPGSAWGGGLVTLVAGPPGSGKTSLCLTIASHLAELGSLVKFVSTEESSSSLEAKQISIAGQSLARCFFPWVPEPEATKIDIVRAPIKSALEAMAKGLETSTRRAKELDTARGQPSTSSVYLTLPRVVVLDSVARTGADSPSEPQRSERGALNAHLDQLRRNGFSVFLVAGGEDVHRLGIDFLIDNFIQMGLDAGAFSRERQNRVIEVSKSRQQVADRGKHLIHLSSDGCRLYPSLHSVLSRVKQARSSTVKDARYRLEVWPGTQWGPPLTVESASHTLLYGFGSASKARLALALMQGSCTSNEEGNAAAVLPTLPLEERDREVAPSRGRQRTMVVSFLYDAHYYERIVSAFSASRRAGGAPLPKLDVLSFYPGLLAPEVVVAKVQKALERADLEGLPFTSALIDGLHNTLLQFPLLEKEPLLWPTLQRIMSGRALDIVSTFTFFEATRRYPWSGAESPEASYRSLPAGQGRLGVAQEAFFHLLVGNCDYTFSVERPPTAAHGGRNRDKVRVSVESSKDGFPREGSRWWDPESFAWADIDFGVFSGRTSD